MKRLFKYLLFIGSVFLISLIIAIQQQSFNQSVLFEIDLKSDRDGSLDLYWDHGLGFEGAQFISQKFTGSNSITHVIFEIPLPEKIQYLRLDLGDGTDSLVLQSIAISSGGKVVKWDNNALTDLIDAKQAIKFGLYDSIGLTLERAGEDPWIIFSKNTIREAITETSYNLLSLFYRLIFSFLIAIALAILLASRFFIVNIVKKYALFWSLLVSLSSYYLTILWVNSNNLFEPTTQIQLLVFSEQKNIHIDLYWDEGSGFNFKHMSSKKISVDESFETLKFNISNHHPIQRLRVDVGDEMTELLIRKITISGNRGFKSLENQELLSCIGEKNNASLNLPNNQSPDLLVVKTGYDPWFILDRNMAEIIENVWEKRSINPMGHLMALVIALMFFFTLRQTVFSAENLVQWTGGFMGRFRLESSPVQSVVFSALFLLVLIVPSILSFVLTDEQRGAINKEKRTLAPKPTLAINHLFEFPEKYNAYYSDHFGFRNELVSLNAFWHGFIFRTTTSYKNVVLGDGMWLYTDYPKPYQFSDWQYSQDELQLIGDVLMERQAWVELNGGKYYFAPIPQKSTIYQEHLPAFLKKAPHFNRIDQVMKFLQENTQVNVVDVLSEIRKKKNEQQIYYTSDTHWNFYGAYIGYHTIMKKIQEDFPEVQPYDLNQIKTSEYEDEKADLGTMLGLNKIYKRHRYAPSFPSGSVDPTEVPNSALINALPADSPIRTFKSSGHTRKLVFFHDSYGVLLTPLFNRHFDTSIFIWSPTFSPEVVQENPDIVVDERVERLFDLIILKQNSPLLKKELKQAQDKLKHE